MPANLSGPTLIVILFIVLLLFGAPKLPALARSLGQSMKILKKEVTTDEKDAKAQGVADDVSEAAAKTELSVEEQLARAKAEAAAAKAEAEALKQQASEAKPQENAS